MSKTLMGGAFQGQNFFDSSSLTIRYIALTGARTGTPTNTEARMQTAIDKAGTFSLLSFYVGTNTQVASSNFRLRVNAASVNQVVAVAGGATGTFQDSTHSDAVSAGDKVNFAHDPLESLKSFTVHSAVVAFEGSSSVASLWVAIDTASGTAFNGGTASVTRYLPMVGLGDNSNGFFVSAEANAATPIRAAGTFSRLGLFISTNTSTNGMTLTWRTTGVDGNQALSIGASATGYIEDTTHTDTVFSGDTVDAKGVSGAGTVNALVWAVCSTFTSAGTNWDTRARNTQVSTQGFSTAAVNYLHLIASAPRKDTTEANVQDKCPFGAYADHLVLVVPTNSANSISPVSRINGSNGNLTVTIGGSATGTFEDTTHVDTLAANDLYCLKYGQTSSTTVCVQVAGVRMDTVNPSSPGAGRKRRVFAVC
jgi:hypothetical protein